MNALSNSCRPLKHYQRIFSGLVETEIIELKTGVRDPTKLFETPLTQSEYNYITDIDTKEKQNLWVVIQIQTRKDEKKVSNLQLSPENIGSTCQTTHPEFLDLEHPAIFLYP